MMRALTLLALMACLEGCGVLPPPPGPPREVLYVPTYAIFGFALNGKYHVQHEYLDFANPDQGLRGGCSYGGGNKTGRAYWLGDMFEKDGHMFQMTNSSEGRYAANIDRFVLGMRMVSRVTQHYNPESKKAEGGRTYIDFTPFCSDRVGSHTYTVSLRKSSAETIDEGIQHTIWILENVWKDLARWEAPVEVRRGANRWIVFKFWNRANYQADAAESWSLPIGDSGYYFRVIFGYKSADIVNNPVDYAKARAAFDRIIDSFVIEPL